MGDILTKSYTCDRWLEACDELLVTVFCSKERKSSIRLSAFDEQSWNGERILQMKETLEKSTQD